MYTQVIIDITSTTDLVITPRNVHGSFVETVKIALSNGQSMIPPHSKKVLPMEN